MESTEWKPSPADVRILCEAALYRYIELTDLGNHFCQYCGRKYGNVYLTYWSEGRQEPHDKDCPVLIARDVLAGMPE